MLAFNVCLAFLSQTINTPCYHYHTNFFALMFTIVLNCYRQYSLLFHCLQCLGHLHSSKCIMWLTTLLCQPCIVKMYHIRPFRKKPTQKYQNHHCPSSVTCQRLHTYIKQSQLITYSVSI